jgi:hypothetical protein
MVLTVVNLLGYNQYVDIIVGVPAEKILLSNITKSNLLNNSTVYGDTLQMFAIEPRMVDLFFQLKNGELKFLHCIKSYSTVVFQKNLKSEIFMVVIGNKKTNTFLMENTLLAVDCGNEIIVQN